MNQIALGALYPHLASGGQDAAALDAALREALLAKCQDSVEVKSRFFEANADKLLRAAHLLADSFRAGGRLYTMGNGGSACDAAHIAVEFQHPVTAGRPALPAQNLAQDMAMISAVGNDVGFAEVFARQLPGLLRAGDVVLGVSTSGNSANVLRGLAVARDLGGRTLGLAGGNGGAMATESCVELCLVVASDSIHRVQETHVAIYHVLWDLVHSLLADDRNTHSIGPGITMKYVDEFRDPLAARALLREIGAATDRLGATAASPLQIMEVCGGHTHSIFRYALKDLIPAGLEFVHGPGCPVCVLPMGRVDDCIAIALQPDVIFTTFGDAMRVPGSKLSLLQARAEGADVRMVYSPLDALEIAAANPDKRVVFFALGFETTMPSTALTVLEAERRGITNFSLFCNHITIVPTIKAIFDSPGMGIAGFIGPGHVAMVIGCAPFEFIAAQYRRPLVVSGFEPTDILQSLLMVLRQLEQGRSEVENQYARLVDAGGNTPALQAITRVFELREFFEWRGLGSIDHSGIRMRAEYARYDAERLFALPGARIADPKSCQCGEVLKGAIKPPQCKVFGSACTPQTPLGALMVSSEGACAAYYQFARRAPVIPIEVAV